MKECKECYAIGHHEPWCDKVDPEWKTKPKEW